MTGKIVVFCTCGAQEEADRIAAAVVGKRLAACVSILPGVLSVYHWRGAIERSQEFLLMIKTTSEMFPQLRDEIEKLHSYQTPEIIAVPVVEGASSYLAWIEAETGGALP